MTYNAYGLTQLNSTQPVTPNNHLALACYPTARRTVCYAAAA